MKRFMLLVVVSAVAIGVVAALPASSGATSAKCKIKSGNKVKCPTSKLKGPQGPQGAQGPQGPQGSGASTVIPFKFLAVGNTGNTTIATFTGAIAESGCQGGTINQGRLRATADNGAAEVMNPRVDDFNFQPDFDTAESVGLKTAGAVDDQHLLVYLAAGGSQSVNAHYGAYDTVTVAGQYDCAIFGAAEVL